MPIALLRIALFPIASATLLLVLLPAAAQEAPPLTPRQLERDTPIARVAREAGPAVVNVYQESIQEVSRGDAWNWFYPPQRSTSLGSGFLIDRDGYILTNAHVIQLGKQGIHVRLADGAEYAAELVSVDLDNDVALLKITPPPGTTLPIARIGSSADVMVGETIVAIGNPLGNENSVSEGIVSSVFREVKVPHERRQTGPTPVFRDYIQVDAPINPGSSGGPLLNILGEVIGINFAIANQAEGIGFAIPIDRVRHTLTSNLMNPRLRNEVVTGLDVQGDAQGRAVTLAHIEPDGPADRAGLREGDRLVSVAGKPIGWEFDFGKALLSSRAGDKVDVVVEREGHTVRAALQLGRDDSPQPVVWRRMGLAVVDHPRFKGVSVVRIDPTGPAAALRLQTGDLIDGLGDCDLDSTADLFRAIRELPPRSEIVVHVWRGNAASWGTFRLE